MGLVDPFGYTSTNQENLVMTKHLHLRAAALPQSTRNRKACENALAVT
jgi:hypothetical protein